MSNIFGNYICLVDICRILKCAKKHTNVPNTIHKCTLFISKTNNRVVSSNINPDKYVNTDTRELLSSQLNDKIHITLREDTNQFSINSDEYVVFDSEAMKYLAMVLNASETAKVFTMADIIKTDCSVLCKRDNKPHNSDSLYI